MMGVAPRAAGAGGGSSGSSLRVARGVGSASAVVGEGCAGDGSCVRTADGVTPVRAAGVGVSSGRQALSSNQAARQLLTSFIQDIFPFMFHLCMRCFHMSYPCPGAQP